MKKLYVIGGDIGYVWPFDGLFEVVYDRDKADVFMFTGGEDVTPAFYGEAPLCGTYFNLERDDRERELFNYGKQHGKSFIGICRGSQFLTVMSGGKLYQHVDNHGVWPGHVVKTYDDREYLSSSTHHQMMRPHGVNHKLLAWCSNRSKEYLTAQGNQEKPEVDVEAVWYPDTKALCIQGHPEIMKRDAPFIGWCRKQVEIFLLNKE